ncbi:hypothetical protein KPH14_007519 [Odynerus spinipes]|uniref:Uncharacterized protein n=1 Tax=Odynerus spinipes TaxID=1348599 RepID=A0AAD9RHL8_9HYME|nr:hypothetical protein KPH14_007519 [Odynerus spinipes]
MVRIYIDNAGRLIIRDALPTITLTDLPYVLSTEHRALYPREGERGCYCCCRWHESINVYGGVFERTVMTQEPKCLEISVWPPNKEPTSTLNVKPSVRRISPDTTA